MSDAGRRWDEHAAWWQQEFTDGADPEYEEQIIPLVLERTGGRRLIVDVGTGEGQLARAIRTVHGTEVVGLDPSPAQIATARERGGGLHLALATASHIPLGDECADAVVVCLVLEHTDDLDGAMTEISRILVPGGLLLLLLNHPLLQTPGSGMIVDHILDPPETYWRIGPYLPEAETVEEVHKDVFVRFLHRPLSRYVNSLLAAGLQLRGLTEPEPPAGFIAKAPEYEHDVVRTTPRLLLLEAERPLATLDGA